MFTRRYLPVLTLCLFGIVRPINAELANGPMLADVAMREASVWIQAKEPSVVRVRYSTETEEYWTLPIETDNHLGHTATLTLGEVEPAQRYSYQIELNGTLLGPVYNFESPVFFHERTPPPDLRVAVGGAHYVTEEGFEPPYRILGGGYGIFDSILRQDPDLMLWVGNTTHLRPSDWNSRSGYLKRFTKSRSIPEMKPLLASIPHYATWGSSDYGQDNAGRYYAYRDDAESTFRAFWPRPSEAPGLEGIVTRLTRSDVDFFLLDVRSHRDDAESSTNSPSILGSEQIEWLRNELIRSTATFKVIVAGAPILNPADNPSNLSYAESEHTGLLEVIRDERISGLFFISGGKYFGELTRLVHASSYNIHDLTIGPLTAEPREDQDELNFFRMPGTSRFERQFAIIDFTGPEDAREISIRVMGMEGTELWSRSLQAVDMKPKE